MIINANLSLVYYVLICLNSAFAYEWENLINGSKLYASELYLLKRVKHFESISVSVNVSQECRTSIRKISDLISNLDVSALKMINSWGRFPPSGALTGTVTDFGDYDQCLSITPNEIIGRPQYCLVDISLPLPQPMSKHQNFHHTVENILPKEFDFRQNNSVFDLLRKEASIFYWIYFRLGICSPDKCSKGDIFLMADKEISKFGLRLKNVKCEIKSESRLNFTQTIAVIVFGVFLFLSIIGALLETFLPIKRKNIDLIVRSFSLVSNAKKLLTTKTNYELSCFAGIRVVTVVWVIFGHVVGWASLSVFSQTFRIKHMLSLPANQLFFKAYNSVEIFFFISGMLTSYITLSETKGNYKNFNTLAFLLFRYIRLTPQLIVFMLLTTLVPLFGSGPIWREWITPLVTNCYRNWWQNLFYVQNLIDAKNMCALHTWYIATDMQYHWLSLIVIIAMLHRVKLGLAVDMLIVVLFYLISYAIILVNDFPPGYVNTGKNDFYVNEYDPMFYWKPWSHGSVFFVGLAFGIFAHNHKSIKLSNSKKLTIWCALMVGYVITTYDVQYWIYGAKYNRWISALLYPTTRLVMCANTGVLIFMCVTGNGGFVNRFLSWRPFVPLARLTYSVYLTHAWTVWIYMGSRRRLIEPDTGSLSAAFANQLLVAYFIGACFSLLFEAPVLALLNHLLERCKRGRDKLDDALDDGADRGLVQLNGREVIKS